jgi:asparagine synthase (glutamine-hydrolysing)
MKGILPDAVLRKKKTGFNPPMPEWITRELKPLISALLSRSAVERRGMFRPDAITKVLQDHFTGKRDNGVKIWGLLMLEVWYQMYIDKQIGEPVLELLPGSASEVGA